MSQANTLLTKVWEVFFFICKNECKIEK